MPRLQLRNDIQVWKDVVGKTTLSMYDVWKTVYL